MSDFNSALVIPDLSAHLQRGGVSSMLFIEVKTDFTDVVDDAEWDLVSMLQQSDFSNAPSGAQGQDLSVTLIDGVRYAVQDTGVDEGPDVQEVSLQILMSDPSTLNLHRRTKGKKFFFVRPIKFVGAVKWVEFGYGEFKREFTYSQSWGAFHVFNAAIRYQPTQLATTPTFPVLPTNADTLFTTDEANMKYIGWLLAAADATKGGFGAAVAMPTFTDLPGSLPSVLKTFSV